MGCNMCKIKYKCYTTENDITIIEKDIGTNIMKYINKTAFGKK
jgi:hypothetical protein